MRALVVAALLLAGCAAAPAAPDPPSLPTLAVGTSWHLQARDGSWHNSTVTAYEERAGVSAYRIADQVSRQGTNTIWASVPDLRIVAVQAHNAGGSLSCDGSAYYPWSEGNVTCRAPGAVVRFHRDVGPLHSLSTPLGRFDVRTIRLTDSYGVVQELDYAPTLGHPVREKAGNGPEYLLAWREPLP